MRKFIWLALASASISAISSGAWAQPAGATSSEDSTLAEIVVTARRRAESLQDVPQTVNAVTGATLEKLNIRQFEDVETVVPGLTLTNSNNGFSTAATIRGAPFNAESGAQPTVAFYLNDATIQSIYAFQSMFDVGQIEVLRGPQGTLRGKSSPSGAITLTTRRPTLGDFGAYGNLTVTDQHARNLNGAVNVPIIRDVLGLRVAGIIDDNHGNGVGSINSRLHPSAKTWAVRPSLRFEPNDAMTVDLMYQHLEHNTYDVQQVASFSLFEPSAAPVQPIVRPRDRVGIESYYGETHQKQDLATVNAEYRFAGQKLSYVGSYSSQKVRGFGPQDPANAFPAVRFGQPLLARARQTTNELRLSSDERLFGQFDYTVGVYGDDFKPPTDLVNTSVLTIFGRFAGLAETPIEKTGKQRERSVFGNATWHIGEATELSGGLRRLWYRDSNNLVISGAPILTNKITKADAWLYNASLSHRFTSDFLVYANTGKAFRPGPFVIGVFRPLTPALERHIDLADETSKSYEVGFKSTLFDKRVLVNAAVFHQDFNNFIYRGPQVYYLGLNAAGPTVGNFNFGDSVDAKIDGVDVDASWQVMQGFNLSGSLSYAKSRMKKGVIACNDLNRDGVRDVLTQAPTLAQLQAATGAAAVSECAVNDPLQFTPKVNANLTGEYSRPFGEGMEGYVRGLVTFRGKTEGDPSNPYDSVNAFALVNLYTGVRSRDGAWEVALFAKNLLNTEKVVDVGSGLIGTSAQELQPPTFRTVLATTINSSYTTVRTTAPREIGLNVRYAFGSR